MCHAHNLQDTAPQGGHVFVLVDNAGFVWVNDAAVCPLYAPGVVVDWSDTPAVW